MNYISDHRFVMGCALVTSTTVAAYSSIGLWRLKRRLQKDNVYESQKSVNEYLAFHYAKPEEILKFTFGPKDAVDFPKRCAEMCMKYYRVQADSIPNRALDIGCAVGRSCFELARDFNEVVGIDYSQSFVDTCKLLREQGTLPYSVTTVGDLQDNLQAVIPQEINRYRTEFFQGDACCLPLDLGQFGCVLAANLICRLHSPQDFLDRLPDLVAPGGVLVITSPYTFMAEFTPRDNWIGGFMTNDGQQVSGFDGLKARLVPNFDLLAQEDMPFFIRETARKNQWTVAHATIWKRKQ